MEEILPLVYDELRRMAARKLRDERTSHTLSATALVHEAWLELTKLNRIQWQNRSHYLAVAAQAMRRILIDYAVARGRQKRGGGQTPIHARRRGVGVAADTRRRASRPRRSAGPARRDERAPGANRRMPVLRRDERGGDRRRAERVAGHRQARVGHGARLAESGAASGEPSARHPRCDGARSLAARSGCARRRDRLPDADRAARCSTPAAPATRRSDAKWSRC